MNEMTRITAQPAYSDAASKALARKPQLFIDGAWVDSTGGKTLAVIDPSTGREVGRFVDATDADVDRAVAAARTAFDDGRWTGLPPIVRERMIHEARRSARAACRRVRRAGGDRQWQAQGHRRRGRYSRRDRDAALHGRLGDQDRRRDRRPDGRAPGRLPRLCPPRADRRRRPDRAVELPDDHGDAEDRPGARRRLHPGAEARRADLGDRLAPRRSGERGRLPGGRDQHRHRARRDCGRPAGPPSGRRQGRLHRLDRGRQDHQPRRAPTASSGSRSSLAASRRSSSCPTSTSTRPPAAPLARSSSIRARSASPARACSRTARSSTSSSKASPATPSIGHPGRASRPIPIWARSSPTSSRKG